jgi:hypothetical protein
LSGVFSKAVLFNKDGYKMKKRVFTGLIAALLLTLSVSVPVFATDREYDREEGDFRYNGEELVDYIGDSPIVNVPEGTTKIGGQIHIFGQDPNNNSPFIGKHNIKEINFPASIADGQLNGDLTGNFNCDFQDMPNLEAINVDKDNPYYISIDGVLYLKPRENESRMRLIWYPQNKKDKVYNIPENVYFFNNAIIDNYNLEVINYPSDFPSYDYVVKNNLLNYSYGEDFEYTPALKAFTVDPENPNYKTIDGVLYAYYDSPAISGWFLLDYPVAREAETYIITDDVIGVLNYGFVKEFKYLKNVVWDKTFSEDERLTAIITIPSDGLNINIVDINLYVPRESYLSEIISIIYKGTGTVNYIEDINPAVTAPEMVEVPEAVTAAPETVAAETEPPETAPPEDRENAGKTEAEDEAAPAAATENSLRRVTSEGSNTDSNLIYIIIIAGMAVLLALCVVVIVKTRKKR